MNFRGALCSSKPMESLELYTFEDGDLYGYHSHLDYTLGIEIRDTVGF